MKQYLLLPAFILATIFAQAQPYTVGTKNVTFTDPARSNRSIPVEIRYPGNNTAMVNDSFPFIVFGHGFQMTGNNYYSVFDSLVRQGYIVALPGTETSFSPSHSDFGKDFIFIYDKLISESQTNSSSFLYNHVIPRGAIGGHSMGGGSTVLSCQFSTPATCYFTFAAANTNPSSIAAAPSMNKPYLAIAGSRDCIAPPAANQVPMYDSSGAPCKVYVSILDATHCQFGPNSVACNFGEGVSGCASTPLSSTAQVSKTLSFLTPYLNYYLKQQCSAWTQFEALYAANTTDDLRRSCTNTIPTNPGITGDNSFCAGNNTVLTAAPAGFTYSWSNATTTQTNTVSTAGTYGVTVSNGVCAVTATPVAVTETALPGTPSSITMPDTVCAGIANIEIAAPVLPPGDNYVWTLPAGWVATSSNPTTIYVTSGNTGGTVSVAIGNSCGLGTPLSVPVVVVPSNLGTPGTITGPDSVCSSIAVSFSIAAVSGSDSYVWSFPSGWSVVSGDSTLSVYVAAGSVGGVVSVSAVNGCGESQPATRTVVVPVLDEPGAITGDDTLCAGAAATYSIAAVNGANAYQWSFPSGWSVVSGNSTSAIQVTAGVAGGTVSVAAEGACGVSQAVTAVVEVNTAPTLTGEILAPDTVCQGGSQGTFFSLNPFPTGNDTYNWTLPGDWSFVASPNSASPIININSAGTVQVSATNACGNSNTLSLNIAMVDTPAAQITVAGTVLNASPTGAGYTYSWFADGQLIQNASGSSYTPVQDGNYTVVVNGPVCSGQSAPVNFIYNGLQALATSGFQLYPNPVNNGTLQLTTGEEMVNSLLQVLDAQGKLVYSTSVNATQTTMQLPEIAAGIYVVSLQKKGMYLQQKLVVF